MPEITEKPKEKPNPNTEPEPMPVAPRIPGLPEVSKTPRVNSPIDLNGEK